MEFVVTLQCEGSIDCEKFTQAILLEVKQHPLLQANAEIGPNHRQSYWKVAAEPLPQINWIEKEFLPEQGFPEDFEPIDLKSCLLYTSPSPRDQRGSRMPSSA